MRKLTLALATAAALSARADEGMWTYDNFPRDAVQRKYGFRPDDAWLARARLSSARLAQGCSAGFVSPKGLVATNHHCVASCVQDLSTPQKDLVRDGFYARRPGEELTCPNLEVNQLVGISDVTARMSQATAQLEGKAYGDAQRAETARIEKECQTSDALRCEVVSLYRGGAHALYTYRRYQDVRLAFAPEEAIAFFGGDPDNFNFPRYDLDVALLRIYRDGAPAATPDHFRWSPTGPKDGELTFVSGQPGGTSRLATVAQLEYQRDVALPESLLETAESRGLVAEYQRRGPEQARHSRNLLFHLENALKAQKGRHEALADAAFFRSKVESEEAFRAALRADPQRASRVLPAFDAVARAERELKAMRKPLRYLEHGAAFGGRLFRFARTLLRAAEERPKRSEVRLREYRDSAIPALTQGLLSRLPVYDELEAFLLTHSLTRMRQALGADHPVVRKVLGAHSPAEVAERLVKGTRLREVAERRRYWEGGRATLEASQDAMILLARKIDPEARAVRARYEDDVESVVRKSEELLARARFELYGTSAYPDATFTLRLSYGAVKGWVEDGKAVPPFTRLGGAFERHTGREPFALPRSWLDARGALDPATPFNFATSNDIIGGNSGSPVFNRDLELVGLVFDGNIWSLGGEYGFDESNNRTVAVDSAAVLEALRKVYRADRLAEELVPATRAGR